MATLAPRGAELLPSVPVRPGLRVVAVVACTALAYSFSLQSLVGGWRYETPLAQLALVPFLAVLLLFAAYHRHPHVVALRLARVDVVLSCLLLIIALGLIVTGPVVWSKYFWATRLDLLTLPLFVCAALVLLFGARAVVRFGFALGFLLLAWPLPYHAVLERTLGFFTWTTTWGVAQIAPLLDLASPDPSLEGGFLVEHGGRQFSVVVGAACAGVNGFVGFLIVAAFSLYFIRGGLLRRAAWLAVGALLVWVFNVLRIVGILAVGRELGEDAAFRVIHPIAGLIALNAAVVVLVVLMRPFGLRWRRGPVQVDSPLAAPAQPEQQATARRFVPRLGILVAATAVLALANIGLRDSARGFSNDGRPAVAPFVSRPSVGSGWAPQRVETIGWATPYYGEHSSWVRYRLRPTGGAGAPFTIWLDAVRSPDLGALDAYTLAHCYDFHDFDVALARRVDLGDGVVGQAYVFDTPRARWHAVSWQWPVLLRDGSTEHERIVLLASSDSRPGTRRDSSGGIRGFLLSLLNVGAPDHDDNPALTSAMREVAAAAVHARVQAVA